MAKKRKDEDVLSGAKLSKQIEKKSQNLYYISETDAEILLFTGAKADAVTKENLLSQLGIAADSPVEERNFSDLFARLTKIQDWFGDDEKVSAKRFAELKELLESNLKDLKVFKIGKIELDIYVVGLDAEGNLSGIKTKSVET